MNLIAIDPGKDGGIAALCAGEIRLFKMPDTEGEICQLLRELSLTDRFQTSAMIEIVGGFIQGNAAPGSAMFNFGANYGVLIGCCLGLNVPLLRVRPQEWQKSVGFSSSAKGAERKRQLKAEAQRRYPHLIKQITLKTCDALLMLEYARARVKP